MGDKKAMSELIGQSFNDKSFSATGEGDSMSFRPHLVFRFYGD